MCDYYVDLAPGAFRLLSLHPRRLRKDDCIETSISIHRLADAPPYEALSYVWGQSEHPIQIIVNDRPSYVTKNLHEALMRLRDKAKYRTLWVDAVCINQRNDTEKSQQVLHMRSIFAKARQTLMWLGEESPYGRDK